MGLQDFKKRFSSHPSRLRKGSDLEAPSPTIPMDSKRILQARGDRQRIADHAGFPQSLSSHALSNSASGEPLFQDDFPTRSFPHEFKPYTKTQDFGATGRRNEDQRRAVKMDLGHQEQDPGQPRRSNAQTSFLSAPSREGTPVSQRARRNSHHSNEPEQNGTRQEMPHISDLRLDSDASSSPVTSKFESSRHSNPSVLSVDTKASSVESSGLAPLQIKSVLGEGEHLEPLIEDDPASFDLVLPADGDEGHKFQLEDRSEMMFSREHLLEIFKDTTLLLRFTNFLSARRPRSIALLVYYLDALKALRAIKYANAVAEALTPLDDHEFSLQQVKDTTNSTLEEKAKQAFDALVRDDLPAFITYTYIRVVSMSISRRITGTLPAHLREASEGLAEVFCLTDPSRKDNPIIFSSEEFYRTTQYGVNYAIGRNCRFLQGPRTNKHSVQRLAKAVREQREVSEVFLNYRRDGSPFMNLLMTAPLLDSKGTTRYFIGAQVDVSGLCKEGTDLPGLQRLIAKQYAQQHPDHEAGHDDGHPNEEEKDAFQELVEMFNETELSIVSKHGGKMHREHVDENEDANRRGERPRLLIKEPSDPATSPTAMGSFSVRNGRLEGVYQHYLLVRPYPSLRILFCSPSLRVPGILQSPFLDRIGGSNRVRDTLVAALADGRGVTAKVRWVSGRNGEEEGRPRWIHCTPLLGQSGSIGVWMVVLIEDENATPQRKFRQPPPVDAHVRARKSELEMFNPPALPDTERRQHSYNAQQRIARPETSNSAGNDSMDSFTIEPA